MLAGGRELPELSRFRLLSRVGAGASGTVYRAYEHAKDRIVALKIMHDATPQALVALRAEFETLSELDHPNIVRLHEVQEECGVAYVVMELVEGVDFVRYVRPHPGSFHEERLRDALVQCVVALDQLHALGKVHRDVKPPNVRVTPQGRVVLLDFGLLVDVHAGLSSESSDALQAGTAAYMAPEQAVGDPVSPATDLYAVGTMLYQALTGDLPFHGSAHDMRVAKVSTPAPDPRARGVAMPDDLARLCLGLLALEPSERPDVRQLLTELGAAEKVRASARRASLPPVHRVPFVGRAPELASLELIALRPKHDTQCLHVVGGPGVGKTALMREAARRLAGRPNVLWLECTASPAQRGPYEGFHGIIEQLASYLMRAGVDERMLVEGAESLHELFPALRRVGGIPHRLGPPAVPDRLERRWRALSALKHMLACIAEERPVVIWIDDWHHADRDSVRVAGRLFRGHKSPGLLVVLASTPGDVALPLSERQVMVLGPLTGKESTELLHVLTRGDRSEPAEEERVLTAAQGHPLALVELLRLSRESGSTERLPSTLDEALAAHVALLRGDARQLLELLALLDTPLSAELAQVALAFDATKLSRAAAELVRTGLMLYEEATHGLLTVAHRAIAQVVRALIDPERAIELHRHIADALSGADIALLPALTRHAMAADRPELAADAAFRVSRAAADVLAMDRAATYHSLAAELTQQKAELVQYQSARALAETLADAGRSVEAAYAYQLAYQTANAANALELHRRSAELFVHSGHMEEAGLSCMRDALSTVGETLPETGRGALLSLFRQRVMLALSGLGFVERTVQQVSARDLTRIDVLWSVGATLGLVDHIRGADFQARSLRYALRAGERTRVARALALESALSAATEKPPRARARQLLGRAEALSSGRRDPYLAGLVAFSQAMFAWSEADHARYLPLALEAEQLFRSECTDVLWEVTSAQQLTVTALHWLARFKELDERVQRYQQEALERGNRHAHASLELFAGYMRLLAYDEPKTARARIKEAASLFPRDRFLLQHAGEVMGLLCIDQYEQRPLDPERVAAARAGAQRSYLLRTVVGRYVILNAEARLCVELAQRSPTSARAQAQALYRIARGFRSLGIVTGSGEADLWTAHAHALAGRTSEVPALLEAAERALSEQAPALALAARYRRGRLLKGDAGQALVQEVNRVLKAEGVRNVGRLMNAYFPALPG